MSEPKPIDEKILPKVEVPKGQEPVAPPPAPSTPAASAPTPQAPAPGAHPTPTPPSWKIPEGFNLPPDTKSAIEAALAEGARPEHLQRFIDLHVNTLKSQMTKAEQDKKAAIDAWTTAAVQDKDFGGPKFDQSREAASAFINSFGDDDLRKYLTESGAGYHPGLFRTFARAGAFIRSRMTEDSLASMAPRSGGVPSRPATQQERLERMYDSPDMQRLRKK